MKTFRLSRSSRQPGCFAGALAIALGLLFAAFFLAAAVAATQSNSCETVLTYGTGTSPTGAKLRLGSVDPFFDGTSANFPDRGAAYVVTNPPAAWIANSASADSQWIGPSPDVSDDAAGTYVYRLQFTTPCAGARLTGRYAASDRGALRLNGAAVSFPTPATGWTAWTAISFASLPVGVNTLEFYVTNSPSAFGPPGPTGLRAELTVTATCCPCIELTCPPDIYLTTCSTGATANFSVAGTNRCDTNLTITCTYGGVTGIPATTNTVFPPGTNIVNCLARDTVGHTTNCSFRVVVTRDSRPPEIRCPDDIFYLCRSEGTNVFYNVTATDDTDPNPVVACAPPSGSYFAPGTNIVTCEARDSCGRVSRCSFRVIRAPNGFVKALQAGVADNFSPGGLEAPVAGPCLGGSGYWSGLPFDASWPGRQFSQSFQGLPSNISAAKLILRMKPMQTASQDDVLRLGLQNCGAAGVWAFAQPVASLPGAGGTWSANPPTTFTLNLAALPGGVSLLADLNASHRLEFAVGTETMVDYARIEITYCGPQSTLSGVPYSMSNVYPIHQGRGGVSWHTVNSNDPPTLEFDAGGADGLRFDFVDPGLDLVSPCQGTPIGQHKWLLMNWPTGGETFAQVMFIPGQAPEPFPDPTLITLDQIGTSIGRVVEVWNGGQLVSRYYVPGNFPSAVIVPSSACLVQMGFSTAFFFAAFESAVPVIVNGQLVAGQPGPGTAVLLYFVVTVDANEPSKRLSATLPPDGFDVSRMSLLRDDTWIDPFGPQLVSASDLLISTALIEPVLQPYGDCVNVGINGWNVELQNGLADFCEFDGQTVTCTPGHVDLTMYGMGQPEIKYGGLRLSLALSYPFDNCRIENTIPNAAPYSVVITRPAPATPITLNGVTNVETLHWPVKVSGGPGPQSWTVELPPATTVTAAGQTHAATHVTFLATPTMLDQFYRVCVQTMDSVQIVMKSLNVPPPNTPPPPPPCLTLTCPNDVVVPGVSYAIGTVVTFNPTATALCGSNVVITCVPPSGSVFAPGHTVVHCGAIDSLGNQDRCSFLVTVRDGSPPHLIIPGPLVVSCDGARGTVVNFTASAEDALDPSPVVECVPPSGSLFPPGTNRVSCVATDAAGNRSASEFPVIVTGNCDRSPPTISDVQPRSGRAGDLVTISGRDFGADADDLLVYVQGRNGVPTLLPVISVTETQIVAQIGAVRPDAQAGPVVVARGLGARSFPEVPGAMLYNGAVDWKAFPDSAGIWAGLLDVLITPARCFYSQPPPFCDEGTVCVFLVGDWPVNGIVSIEALFSSTPLPPDPNQWPNAFTTEFQVPGGPNSGQQCAQLICQIISAIYSGLDDVLHCSVAPAGTNTYQLTFTGPWTVQGPAPLYGYINICVRPPVSITGSFQSANQFNHLVTINGSGFGMRPDDLLVYVEGGNGTRTLLPVISATETQIVARVGIVRPDAQSGPITVARGVGFPLRVDEPDILSELRQWVSKGQPVARGPGVTLPFLFADVCYFSEESNGVVCLVIGPDNFPATLPFVAGCEAQDIIVEFDLNTSCPPPQNESVYSVNHVGCIDLAHPLSPQSFAGLLCTVNDGLFGPEIQCDITTLPDGRIKLTFSSDVPVCGEVNICYRKFPFGGLPHLAAGEAELNADAAGRLRVSNLGPSGNDGLRVELGKAQGLSADFEPFALGDGQKLTSTLFGEFAGRSNRPLATTTIEVMDGQTYLSSDWSYVGADRYVAVIQNELGRGLEWAVFDNHERVAVDKYFPRACAQQAKTYSQALLVDQTWTRFCKIGCECLPGTNCWLEVLVCTIPINSAVLGNVFASAVEMKPSLPIGTSQVVRASAAAGPLTSLVISSEHLRTFGRFHRALGDAVLGAENGRLRLGNLGASGMDGVAVNLDLYGNFLGLPAVRGYRVGLEPLAIPAGGELKVRATGVFNGAPDSLLGHAGVRKPDGSLGIFADFAPIGSAQVTAEVYEAGRRVGTRRVNGGGRIATLTNKGGPHHQVTALGKAPPLPFCFLINFDHAGTFTFDDGTQFEGDEIRLLASASAGVTEALSTLEILGQGLGRMTILSETVLPIELSVRLLGNQAEVSWTGAGTLEEAENPAGPWTAVTPAPASNPYLAPAPPRTRFFRVRH